MTVGDALAHCRARLHAAGVASPEAEAWLLLEAATGLERLELLLHRGRPLEAAEEAQLAAWLQRREAREPLQHVLGRTHFYGLEVRVTPAALVPRPETEQLVELVLRELRGVREPRLLDVGTGSGAVALAVKHERPDATVMGSEWSAPALELARANARRLRLQLEWRRSDLLADPEVAAFAAGADALVANLPYLPERDRRALPPEVQRDPPEALFSGADGLDHFRRLEAQARRLLQPGRTLWLELDPRNAAAARTHALTAGWASARLHDDLTGRTRFLQLVR